MKFVLNLLILSSLLPSCTDNKIDSSFTSCTNPDTKLTRTGQFIRNVSVTVIAVTSPNKQVNYQLMRGGTSAALGSCNLPPAFAKDSLKVTISGYFLTFPGLELMNLSPLPFEVTEVKLRE